MLKQILLISFLFISNSYSANLGGDQVLGLKIAGKITKYDLEQTITFVVPVEKSASIRCFYYKKTGEVTCKLEQKQQNCNSDSFVLCAISYTNEESLRAYQQLIILHDKQERRGR